MSLMYEYNIVNLDRAEITTENGNPDQTDCILR